MTEQNENTTRHQLEVELHETVKPEKGVEDNLGGHLQLLAPPDQRLHRWIRAEVMALMIERTYLQECAKMGLSCELRIILSLMLQPLRMGNTQE